MITAPIDRTRAALIPLLQRRGRRATPPPPSLGRAIEGVFANGPKPAAEAGGPAFARITRAWADIVGAETAALAQPVKLAGRGAKGVLHLAARGPAALVVQADAARILGRVNTFAGTTVAGKLTVARIAARAAAPGPAHCDAPPKPPPLDRETRAKLHESLAPVAHPELKRALASLGEAVLARDPRRHLSTAARPSEDRR